MEGKCEKSLVSYFVEDNPIGVKLVGLPGGVAMATGGGAVERGHKIQTYLINLHGRSISFRHAERFAKFHFVRNLGSF